ncbi:uncharacterized protein Z520_10320 [Fonsecaea multimorphosa CBS 102226]|uniref:BZIP domain-containing protein n=1 Tax=Fonsecaea multimorphosa CBS 102226 TaxID=1442371 RepID=A0A0D2KBI4_9EURO|nr:uncharacterized protein Z520_10320 [Fonsecaea multimorphosa CBS 102226]KIX93983.1 hypothetical protein Z520_10320 [Fonsecaea multimorphosa CBS 102226]OAL19330.1 hypothetical protein AYO22_09874 [Fonsecaea multimorphosa]
MREKSTRPRPQAPQGARSMDSFISVFHAGSLDRPTPQTPSQPQTQSHQQPQRPASNPYCYIPGQYWESLGYYDMAMDICTDFSDLSQINPSFVSNHKALSFADDLTPLDSPLDFATEHFGSPGDSLQLARTNSAVQESPDTEAECLGQGRCNSQNLPCKICEKKKERRKEQNRKAQRNHRLRSEAKLEQLRAKVKSQSDEIVMLRDFNQSLLKHIETLESKSQDGGTADAGTEAEESNTLGMQPPPSR